MSRGGARGAIVGPVVGPPGVARLRLGCFAGRADEWDAFVRSTRGWTHFHLYGWRSVMERALGHECLYLEARDAGGALVGVLPLVRVRSLLFGHFLVSMPFVNYGGPLGTDQAIGELGEFAAALAERERVTLLELRSRVPLPLSMAVSHRKVTSVLDLVPGDSEAVFASLPAAQRTKIRRAGKERVTVRMGPDQLGAFHEVFSRNMRHLGTPTQPRSLFAAIAAAFPNDALFACAYVDATPVACGAGFFWNGEFEMTWASALREYDHTRANPGLYWAVIAHAASAGCHTFNFGRSTPGSGPHIHKRRWGARDEPLWWYERSRGGASGATPSPTDGAFAWGPRLWRHLPLALTNWLGPRIVRFIP